jgi:hypothetical protein
MVISPGKESDQIVRPPRSLKKDRGVNAAPKLMVRDDWGE